MSIRAAHKDFGVFRDFESVQKSRCGFFCKYAVFFAYMQFFPHIRTFYRKALFVILTVGKKYFIKSRYFFLR